MSALQDFLVLKFVCWRPAAPAVVERGCSSVTLQWSHEEFPFLKGHLLYRVEKKQKLPKWVVVYSGGKTEKRIDNLPPAYPHRFRLRVILQASSVPRLAELSLQHYGTEEDVYQAFANKNIDGENEEMEDKSNVVDGVKEDNLNRNYQEINVVGEGKAIDTKNVDRQINENEHQAKLNERPKTRWLDSLWSDETWTNTESVGASAACFCMAVKCGYVKQIQLMLEERPELIELVNVFNGFTPLATAIQKGDISMVRLLLTLGADVEQRCAAGQAPLHLAALAGDTQLVTLFMDRGADMQARDWNGLRVEHYAVDSGSVEMLRLVLDRGGDVRARDHNLWTPLFRAVCEGARTEMVQELVSRGSDLDIKDKAGLPLASVARLLRNRHGQPRESIIRLVDSHYPHEKALASFTRVSKKIHHLHTMLNLT